MPKDGNGVFNTKSVMFTFPSLFLVPLIFIVSNLNLLTLSSIFSIRRQLRGFFLIVLNWPYDQSAVLITEPQSH
jgi:hypothetical protein